ncbi:DUF5684 domain-containing protein [Leucobacter sp. HY1910]
MFALETITDSTSLAALNGTTTVIALIWYVIIVIALWRVFSKAGYPGILAIIPIVNVFFLVKIAGYSAWMTLLLFVPIVNFIFAIFVALRTGERFGKGGVFSIFLLWLFSAIGYLILGFGSATYSPRRR